MKLIGIITVLGIILVAIYFTPVNTERMCYEKNETNLENLNSNVLTKSVAKIDECRTRSDILYTLETCIQDATKSSSVAVYTNDAITRLVSLVRPYTKNLWKLKADHNLDCANYSWYQLP